MWNIGLLEGVSLTGATVWMSVNQDLSNAKVLSRCDLSGLNLSSVDLSGANLLNTNMKIVNLSNAKLHNAHLSEWNSGLMEGTKLAGSEEWVPTDKDLSNVKLKGADVSKTKMQGTVLKGADLSKCDLSITDLSNAKLQGAVLKGADLSKCDLSDVDLTGADLREAKLDVTNLCSVILHVAKAVRPTTTLPVPDPNGNLFNVSAGFKVGKPVVFALTSPHVLTLQRVTL